MSPSKAAKEAGLTSLAEASKMTGKSVQTLSNWYKQSPELFHIVILGCVKLKQGN